MTARLVAALVVGGAVLLLSGRRTLSVDRRGLSLGAAIALPALAASLIVTVDAPAVVSVLALAVVAAAAHAARRRRATKLALRRRDDAISACAGLVADLQAGLPPTSALQAVAEEWPDFRPVADAGRLGADVPTALRVLADRPGAASLRWVAAAWSVARRSGSGLAVAVDLAARAMVDERATAAILDTELASVRATARLLAVLPVGVLMIGRGAGGDPFGFLLRSPAGNGCLAIGLLLAWAGLLWIERIADGIATS